MKLPARCLPLLAYLLLVVQFGAVSAQTNQPGPANVKRKDGQMVKGKLKGLLVLKGEVKQTEGKARYNVVYEVVNAQDIDLINEEGVREPEGSLSLMVFADGEKIPPDDIEVLEAIGKKESFGTIRLERLPDTASMSLKQTLQKLAMPSVESLSLKDGGMKVFSGRNRKATVSTLKILGEFRISQGKGSIVPAMEVITENGVVTIPIQEIIAFKKN